MSPKSKRALVRLVRDLNFNKRDPLAERAQIAAIISDRQIAGLVAVRMDATDCDGYRYGSTSLIPATVTAYERHAQHCYDGAEGPMSVWPTSREETCEELAWACKYNAGIRQSYPDTREPWGADFQVCALFGDPVC